MRKIILALVAVVIIPGITVALPELTAHYTASESTNKSAPVQPVQKMRINAPCNRVYSIMADVNHWSGWNADISEPALTNAFQKGSSFDWKTGGLTIHSTVHAAVPYQKIGWSGKAFGALAIHNWTFMAQGNYTEVIVEESMEGWLVKLMRNKFQTGLEKSLQTWLKNLKAEAEKG